jgi:hypothetical protein
MAHWLRVQSIDSQLHRRVIHISSMALARNSSTDKSATCLVAQGDTRAPSLPRILQNGLTTSASFPGPLKFLKNSKPYSLFTLRSFMLPYVHVRKLSKFLKNQSKKHLDATDRATQYLYGTKHFAIEFSCNSQPFLVVSDAAFDGNTDYKSTEGYLFMLFGGPIDCLKWTLHITQGKLKWPYRGQG